MSIRMRQLCRLMMPSARFCTPISIAEKIVNAWFAEALKALHRGEEVKLPGIGRLRMIDRSHLPGVDPRTGKVLTYSKRQRVQFRTLKTLARELNVKKVDS